MNPAALVPLVVVAVGFVVFCLFDLSRAGEVHYLLKWAWVVICVVSVPPGGIIYLALRRSR